MVVILAMVLALVGAPANTNFACGDPNVLPEYGYTWWGDQSPPLIHVGTTVCAAMLYASASPRERRLLARRNPGIDWTYVEGRGLLVLTHEAIHASGNHDECLTEKSALQDALPAVLSKLFDADAAAKMLAEAVAYDAIWAPVYHGC